MALQDFKLVYLPCYHLTNINGKFKNTGVLKCVVQKM